MWTSGYCTFDLHGFCEWRQVRDGYDDFDWILHKGETLSQETGPKVDSTHGTVEGSITMFYNYLLRNTLSNCFDLIDRLDHELLNKKCTIVHNATFHAQLPSFLVCTIQH
jgi:hypothetical protein